jgi:hypothetical protein
MRWVELAEFPGYRVSDEGKVQSNFRLKGAGYARKPRYVHSDVWKDLKPDVDETGRARYTLRRDGRSHKKFASVLVLEGFVGPRPPGMEACHGDGDCRNNRLSNLRWDTALANREDMVRHGTRQRGRQIHTAKLTEDDVREIRRIGKPLKPLAIRFGVTETTVSYVLNRKVWKHVA